MDGHGKIPDVGDAPLADLTSPDGALAQAIAAVRKEAARNRENYAAHSSAATPRQAP